MNNAIITIKSSISADTNEMIEVVSPGKFEKINDEYYSAIYEETELSGMSGTKTSLVITPKKVLLEREGTTKSKMSFEREKNDVSLYDTPYGTMDIEVRTKELKINMDDNGGQVLIDYTMVVGGEHTQSTNMVINIKRNK